MQIVGGKKKGMKLVSVKGDSTRPILDRVKTALFDTIRNDIQGKTFLDMFGGSGSVGLEAISQGAKHATFLDLNDNAIFALKTNAKKADFLSNVQILKRDAFKFLKSCETPFDIIFIAPPQYKDLWIEAINIADENIKKLKPQMVIVQIDPKEYKELPLKNLKEVNQKRYGNTVLVYYKP